MCFYPRSIADQFRDLWEHAGPDHWGSVRLVWDRPPGPVIGDEPAFQFDLHGDPHRGVHSGRLGDYLYEVVGEEGRGERQRPMKAREGEEDGRHGKMGKGWIKENKKE